MAHEEFTFLTQARNLILKWILREEQRKFRMTWCNRKWGFFYGVPKIKRWYNAVKNIYKECLNDYKISFKDISVKEKFYTMNIKKKQFLRYI